MIEAHYKPKVTPKMLQVATYAIAQIKATGYMPTQQEIGLELGTTQGNVSNILRRMVERGFAERLNVIAGKRCNGYRFHPTLMGIQESDGNE